jgi:TolB-like protein/class 3 adenylate cyclase
MVTQEVKRKLTAILSADVKGYSRLMGEDEKGTVRTLNAYREVMAYLIQHHHGRLVDVTGDNLMAEFASVVDAVACSVEIQKELKIRNADLAENRRMEFRIGINLGDVIEEEGRIYGDGVNIAARLESLSDAGGVCISGKAYDEVKNKLQLGYKYLGEQAVKNVVEPIRAYQILLEPEAAGKVIGEKKAKPKQWQRAAVALLIGAIVVISVIMIWKLYVPYTPQPEITSKEKITHPQPAKPETQPQTVNSREVPSEGKKLSPPPAKPTTTVIPVKPVVEVASLKKMAFPLPDKPSIAVLPFANLSGDPGQDFLVDGITENIITALSSIPQLFVIARNSTYTYKGKSVKVQQVAEELGVRYVLEGSILRSGDRIRVTAQLIDALKGHHLWAERYDREMKDLFSLQDDLTMKILKGMQLKLTHGEQILHGRFSRSLEVWLKLMQGVDYLRQFNIDSNNRARIIAEECITLESDFWGGYILLGSVHMMDYWLGSTKNPPQSLNLAIEYMEKAAALTDRKGRVLDVLGNVYAIKKDYDKAIELGEQAIAMVPNGADAHAWLAMSLNFAGRPEEALTLFEKAMRLNPFPPSFYYLNCGHAYRITGRFQEAVTMYKKSIQLAPRSVPAHSGLAATYALMDKEEEARATAAELLRINPKYSVDYMAKTSPYKRQEDTDRYVEALRKAGLK